MQKKTQNINNLNNLQKNNQSQILKKETHKDKSSKDHILQEFYKQRQKRNQLQKIKQTQIQRSRSHSFSFANNQKSHDKSMSINIEDVPLIMPIIKQHNLLKRNISIFGKENQKNNQNQSLNLSVDQTTKFQSFTNNQNTVYNSRLSLIKQKQQNQNNCRNSDRNQSSRRKTLNFSYRNILCEQKQSEEENSNQDFKQQNKVEKIQIEKQKKGQQEFVKIKTQSVRIPLSNLMKKYENQFRLNSTSHSTLQRRNQDKFTTQKSSQEMKSIQKLSYSQQQSPISFKGTSSKQNQYKQTQNQSNKLQEYQDKQNKTMNKRKQPLFLYQIKKQIQSKQKTKFSQNLKDLQRNQQNQQNFIKSKRIPYDQSQFQKSNINKILSLQKRNKQLEELLQNQRKKYECQLKKNNQQKKFIASIQKMKKTLLKQPHNQQNCDLKQLWRWIKALPKHQ